MDRIHLEARARNLLPRGSDDNRTALTCGQTILFPVRWIED